MINAFEVTSTVLPIANMAGKVALGLATLGTLGAIVEAVRPGTLDRVCTPVLSALWAAQDGVGRAADALGDILARHVWDRGNGRHRSYDRNRAVRGCYHGGTGWHRA